MCAELMRIDFTRELRMLDGSPLRWAQGRDEAATLGMVCIEALLAITSEDSGRYHPHAVSNAICWRSRCMRMVRQSTWRPNRSWS